MVCYTTFDYPMSTILWLHIEYGFDLCYVTDWYHRIMFIILDALLIPDSMPAIRLEAV
jgi:hypothetical protein